MAGEDESTVVTFGKISGWRWLANQKIERPRPRHYFSPPPEPQTPLARMLNGAYNARHVLEANVREYPKSPAAHFGLGRAYRAEARETEVVAEFRKALALDPDYKRAADALKSAQ
jgi:tetratricopeptide (TPR) repeat protein